jgi:SAM-dependent methyltransferase
MGTVQENLGVWTTYDWLAAGDDWSEPWGGTDGLWFGTLWPRLRSFLPTGTILEIAPGYGRCTQYLVPLSEAITLVDLAPNCIDYCRQRFKDFTHIRYAVNDGKSLDMIDNDSIDFVFSWDSLVHVDSEVVAAYLRELSVKLKPGGIGFIHHSNLGSFFDLTTGTSTVDNPAWRDSSMTAAFFREFCQRCHLHCLTQELVPWESEALTDCISVFMRPWPVEPAPDPVLVENPGFTSEAESIRRLHQLYRRPASTQERPPPMKCTEGQLLRAELSSWRRRAEQQELAISQLRAALRNSKNPEWRFFRRMIHGDFVGTSFDGALKEFTFDRGRLKGRSGDSLTVARPDGVDVFVRLPATDGATPSLELGSNAPVVVVSRSGEALFVMPEGVGAPMTPP